MIGDQALIDSRLSSFLFLHGAGQSTREITQRIYQSAIHTDKKWHAVFQSPHKILAFLAQHPEELQAVNTSILEFLVMYK